ALIGCILAIIMMVTEKKEIPTIVSYSAASEEEQQIDPQKIKTSVARKPSSPSSSMARVIASNTSSPVAVPVPKFTTPVSTTYGDGDDFGSGFADGDFGTGGGTTFFGQKASSERIAYVIDFSGSMRGQGREKLMRAELHDSLQRMYPGTKLGMIFFSGPAWVAGGKVTKKGNIGTITAEDGKTYKWKNNGGHNEWAHDGKKESVPWLDITDPEVIRLQEIVKKTPLSGGTVWDNPLHMALDMDPPPQTIYFMTDGYAKGSKEWAKDVGQRAKGMNVTINCVAMMIPKAVDDLKDLSRRTGGLMTIVKENGVREVVK
ncbi:VWA domain-containing protein, partial [Akkermansiaceae bacterium]|nr:VWA domain-containing protein [Akkermansiaceae bacterium]